MLPEIKYFPVNWMDGMKISSRDFIALENAVSDSIRDARCSQLNEFAYGLLPTNNPEVDNYPKLVHDFANGLLVLKECRALTPGGGRIEITEANHERRKYPVQQPSVSLPILATGRYDVYIRLDTSERVGADEFAENNPPRYKSASPGYELSIKSHDNTLIEQENFLKINEVEVHEGRVDVLSNTGKYIPPCVSVNALSHLKKLHGIGEERLKTAIQHYYHLYKRKKEAPKKEAVEALQLSEKLVSPIVSSISHYRYILPMQPPVFTVVYCQDFARFVEFQLDRSFGLPFINESKQGLLGAIDSLAKTEPKHAAIHTSLEGGLNFLDELVKFLGKLSTYDYDKQRYEVTIHDEIAPVVQPRRVEPVHAEQKPFTPSNHINGSLGAGRRF